MSFQKQVNTYSSPAAEGHIASGNPIIAYVAGPGALVSGTVGAANSGVGSLVVGRFAWATPFGSETSERADSYSTLVADGLSRVPSGFCFNTQQANINATLQESTLTLLPWQNCELATRGDFWVKALLNGVSRGQKAFANLQDGSVTFANAGSTIANNAGTASFATNVMTVTVAPAAPLKVGDAVSGSGIPANTYIKAFGTGTGGTGTYTLTTSPGTLAAQAFNSTSWIETSFQALSIALVNEFVKIGYGN